MHWLSTASAWFALCCLLIIAMYILKKRYEPKSISSHLLWRRALQEQEANKPWQRLKQRLLLWLQLLIAILIVLALMEPVIEKQLTVDSHVVILLDRSNSMIGSTTVDGDNYFNNAKQQLLQWIDDQYDGGAVTLITNGDYPTIVLNRSQRKAEIVQAIKDVQPYYGVSDDEAALSLASALAEQDEHTLLHYYVDERFKASEQSLHAANGVRHHWHLFGNSSDSIDGYIRSIMLTNTGDSVSAFVTVIHKGEQSPAQLEIELSAYDEKGKVVHKDKVKEQSQSGGVTTFQLNGLPKAAYYYAELLNDEYDPNPFNNGQYGLIAEQNNYEALLISSGNLFLEKVLQLMNVGVTKLSADSNPPSEDILKKIQFVIVDGEYESLSQKAEWNQLLSDFPLWVFDHPSSSEAATLVNTSPVIHAHPITQYFSMEDTYISVVKELSSGELGSHDVLVEYGGAPVILAGMNEQKPFLRFAFAMQDSDLPLRATFPILMMQSIEYMTSGSGKQLGQMLVGSQPTISLLAGTSSSYWNKIDGKVEGEAESSSNIPLLSDQPINAPSLPGVYELVEQNEDREIVQRRIAIVNGDSSEYMSEIITPYLQQGNSSVQADVGAGTSGWSSLIPWLAALLLLLIVAEWEVYRRGL